MKYSPNAKIAPQRHSENPRTLGAPASGGVKGRAMDPPVAQSFRRILHKKLGQLAKGKTWQTGYGSMAATPVPRGGEITRAGKSAPTRGEKFGAASRNGQDTGPVSPSVVIDKKPGVALSDEPPMVRRGKGLAAHKGSRAPSFISGGKTRRQSY